jgi:hypothetical protein
MAGSWGLVAVAGNEENDLTTPMDPARSGPKPFPADTWGDPETPATWGDPAATVATAGRHHAGGTSRRRLAISAGVVIVAAAIVVPLTLNGSDPSPPPVAFDPSLGQRVPPGSPTLRDDGTSASPTGTASSAGPTAVASATPAPSRRPPTTAANPTSVGPPPFTPVTVEAEAGTPAVTLSGSARIVSYDGASNARIVQNVGEWNMLFSGPGSVRFNGVTFPAAGNYVVTITYVHPDKEPSHSAQVTISGVPPVTVNFTGSSRCCDVTKVSLAVPAGTRTITIANPADRAPAIDKITISS